jgi:uncharacterized protein (DUF305 family)
MRLRPLSVALGWSCFIRHEAPRFQFFRCFGCRSLLGLRTKKVRLSRKGFVLEKYRRFGLLALVLVGSLVLASSCVSGGSSESEQGNGEQTAEQTAEDNDSQSSTQTMGSFDEEKPFDLHFIDQMIIHHQGAITSAEQMIADSERPELRQLSENIQKSQAEQIDQMRTWREEWYPDAGPTFEMDPTQMSEMMGNHQMNGMMGDEGTDAMFLRMMIPHHQLAIDISEQALDNAEHPELKELAQQIIDEQSAEIELMKGYLERIEAEKGP